MLADVRYLTADARDGRGAALRRHAPGDTVVILAKRGGAEIRVTAILGKRGS